MFSFDLGIIVAANRCVARTRASVTRADDAIQVAQQT
jgi:hypothetical protein